MMKWSRGYEVLRTYVRFAFWLTHKRIVVTGRENLPHDKPIIFAANHQNALMDPLALVCTNPLQTLWLTRADIFKIKAARPFLKFLKMIPIYRIRDGKDNLSNNEEIFNQVREVLESKQSVALFPEAAHSGKRQMLSHKKAIPRIALEAEDKNNFQLNLQLVPVGIFYDHYWKFDRTLIVQYGKPIHLDGYKDRYVENQQNAMLTLKDEIYNSLEPLTIQIHSVEYYVDYEDIRSILGKEYSKKEIFSKDPVLQLFRAEQQLIKEVEYLETKQPERFDDLRNKISAYLGKIRAAGFSNELIERALKFSCFILFFQFVGAILSLPVFVFGFLSNVLPFYIPRLLFTRKVKDKAFLSSFNFAMGLIFFPLFYLLEALTIYFISGIAMISVLAFILMPFTGKLAFGLLQFYRSLWKIFLLKTFQSNLLHHFRKMRKAIVQIMP